MNYSDDLVAGVNRNPTHPLSPWHVSDKEAIESIAVDIMNGYHKYSVLDVISEIIYEDKELLARYKEGAENVLLTQSAAYTMHSVLDEATMIMARRIYEGQS